jgi:hypothetical protein
MEMKILKGKTSNRKILKVKRINRNNKRKKELKSLIIATNNIVDNLNLIYTKIDEIKEDLNPEQKK